MPKFRYIYLAQNLLKTRSPTRFEQKKVGDLVSDKIDLSRHGLRQVGDKSVRQVVRQDRSNGIWALLRRTTRVHVRLRTCTWVYVRSLLVRAYTRVHPARALCEQALMLYLHRSHCNGISNDM